MMYLVKYMPKKVKEAAKKIIMPYYQIRIRLRKKPFKFLFIFSHMRSGSTLLAHILFSNPQIIGYGETHIRYNSEEDFKTLICKNYMGLHRLRMPETYVLDKIVQPDYFKEAALKSRKIRTIFLLREPKATLESLLDVLPHWDAEKSLKYYVNRLYTLEKEVKTVNDKERSLYITYEQLLRQTEKAFKVIEGFLGIIRPLSDFTEKIKTGCIVREHKKSSEMNIDRDILEKAKIAFERCSLVLSQYCRCLE